MADLQTASIVTQHPLGALYRPLESLRLPRGCVWLPLPLLGAHKRFKWTLGKQSKQTRSASIP